MKEPVACSGCKDRWCDTATTVCVPDDTLVSQHASYVYTNGNYIPVQQRDGLIISMSDGTPIPSDEIEDTFASINEVNTDIDVRWDKYIQTRSQAEWEVTEGF